MGDIGIPELLIILGIVIAIFGADRLAGVGQALGTSIREFRRAAQEDVPTSTTPTADERTNS